MPPLQYVSRYETFNVLEDQVASLASAVSFLETAAAEHAAQRTEDPDQTDAAVSGDGGLHNLLTGGDAPLAALAASLEVTDYVKLQGAMAAAVLALATTSMRLRGLQVEGHPLQKEKARIEKTLEEVESLTNVPACVNVEAAKRVVRHHTKQRQRS
eukprot:Gregarina_sp_Pseudo_9__5787@NODE_866_length_2120_cov_10_328688_g814_i0_p4_GENE_NODE_866_length_2120_cov_10_328688_g814_i0NODE_866_length_2120_cov_10_328688_g814_i0_p4_ORF_typecomplete_len156_score53_62GBR2_CC/PF18455_1/0_003DAGK_cat/PF00781_24/0_2_NODE_866_length_2120_cov_10_328688_g814_i015031970